MQQPTGPYECDMATDQKDTLTETQIQERRDAALLRALSTPHKRQAEMKVGKAKPKSASEASPKKRERSSKAR